MNPPQVYMCSPRVFFLMIGGITAYSRADGNDQIERDSTDDGQRVGARGLP